MADEEPTSNALPPSKWALREEDPEDDPSPSASSSGSSSSSEPAASSSAWSAKAPEQSPLLSSAPVPSAPAASSYGQPVPARAAGPKVTSGTPTLWCFFTVCSNAMVLVQLAMIATTSGSSRTSWIIGAACVYFFYLCCSLCSPSARALQNRMSQSQLDALVEQLRRARPSVTAQSTSYHYETRTRREDYTDDKGHKHHRHVEYTEKVVTHTAREAWAYSFCRDVSGPPVFQPHLRSLLVKLGKVQDFSDAGSRAAYDAWLGYFRQRHNRDAYQDVSCSMDIPGFVPYVMLQQDNAGWTHSAGAQLLFTLVLCGWAYELCVLQSVPKVRWALVKQLGMGVPVELQQQQQQQQQPPYGGQQPAYQQPYVGQQMPGY